MRQTKEVILNLIVQWEICLWLTACDFGDSSFKPVNVAEISPWFRWKCSLPELNRLLMFPSGGRSHPRLLRSKFYLRGKVNLRKTVYIKIFFFFFGRALSSKYIVKFRSTYYFFWFWLMALAVLCFWAEMGKILKWWPSVLKLH